jgi:hypothetical protein
MIIGKSKKPRCFKNINLEDHKKMYDLNSSAWMANSLFEKWLVAINMIMKSNDRKIFLIMDKCTFHNLSSLSNIGDPSSEPVLECE